METTDHLITALSLSTEVTPHVLGANGDDRGWHPAENVEGWLVPDSYLSLEVDGTSYLGFLVRHAGIVQLGIPTGDGN